MVKKKILIVDDEDSIRFGMTTFLEGSGYHTVAAKGCRQARRAFEQAPPDAAVIDYQLDDGTAIDLLRAFRQSNPDVPLIVMTAYGSVDRTAQAVKEGAARFLDKPVDMRALLKVIDGLVDRNCSDHEDTRPV